MRCPADQLCGLWRHRMASSCKVHEHRLRFPLPANSHWKWKVKSLVLSVHYSKTSICWDHTWFTFTELNWRITCKFNFISHCWIISAYITILLLCLWWLAWLQAKHSWSGCENTSHWSRHVASHVSPVMLLCHHFKFRPNNSSDSKQFCNFAQVNAGISKMAPSLYISRHIFS